MLPTLRRANCHSAGLASWEGLVHPLQLPPNVFLPLAETAKSPIQGDFRPPDICTRLYGSILFEIPWARDSFSALPFWTLRFPRSHPLERDGVPILTLPRRDLSLFRASTRSFSSSFLWPALILRVMVLASSSALALSPQSPSRSGCGIPPYLPTPFSLQNRAPNDISGIF